MSIQPQVGTELKAPVGSGMVEAGAGNSAESALVLSSPPPLEVRSRLVGTGEKGANLLKIPIEIDVAVPVRNFRVRNLLALTTGQLIETQWLDGADLPLAARGAQLAWVEFEVIEQKLAVRIARLA